MKPAYTRCEAPRRRWTPIRNWLDRRASDRLQAHIDAATLAAFGLPPLDQFLLARSILARLMNHGKLPPKQFERLANELGTLAHEAERKQ